MLFRQEAVDNNGYRILIQGRVDVNTAPQLREAIAAVPDGAKSLILDFRDVDYISSAGLREIIIGKKHFLGEDAFCIENVSKEIYELFEDTGFTSMLSIKLMESDISTYVSLSFADFLSQKTREAGEKVVLVCERESYTWEEIDKASQIMADDLARLGVSKGRHVGLCGLNSANWVLAFYAIQKLGAIAMLINPGMKAAETEKVTEIGDIQFLCYGEITGVEDTKAYIEQVRMTENCPVQATYSIAKTKNYKNRFDEYDDMAYRYGGVKEADDPAAMIFTSGSTGRPKGVLLSSYNILNAASVNCKDQTLNDTDKTLLILPLFHIFGLVPGLFANAMADACIYIPKDIRTDTLLEIMEKERCTCFHSVPTMLIALMNNKKFSPEMFSSLRCSMIAGASATESQIRMFKKKFPNDHFLVAYGLSEMAPVTITNYEDTDEHVLCTVGRPVDNIQIKIQNMETKKDCATGESGEILVQGFNLMVGYYKVPIEDQAIDDEGWLHTGDIGLLDEDGYLRLEGRLKELIIRGGENIMPGEVEAAISELSIIDNVRVIGVPSEFFGEEVAACITLLDGEETFDEETVRAELSGKLAKFKVPSYFFVYDEFPTLGSGKIDTVNLKKDVEKRLAAMPSH